MHKKEKISLRMRKGLKDKLGFVSSRTELTITELIISGFKAAELNLNANDLLMFHAILRCPNADTLTTIDRSLLLGDPQTTSIRIDLDILTRLRDAAHRLGFSPRQILHYSAVRYLSDADFTSPDEKQ